MYMIDIKFVDRKYVAKDFYCLITSVGQEKNSESHEELNLRPSDSTLQCFTTEPERLHSEWGLLQSSYDMHPAIVPA